MGLKQVGSAWSRTSKKGNKFISLSLDLDELANLKDSSGSLDLMLFHNTREWIESNPKRPQFQVVCDDELFEARGVEDIEGDIPF